MNLTPETIDRVLEIATPLTVEVNGKTYATQTLRLVEEEEKLHNIPKTKTVTSLDAFAALISREAIELYPDSNLFVSCSAFNRVSVYTDVFTDSLERWERQDLYACELRDAPGWADAWHGYEAAVIALRSQFVPNEGTEYLLDLLSRMSNQADVKTEDNGMTQSTTVHKGIALLGTEAIRPIVPLRPYRTFQEIEQPESEFLVRVRETIVRPGGISERADKKRDAGGSGGDRFFRKEAVRVSNETEKRASQMRTLPNALMV